MSNDQPQSGYDAEMIRDIRSARAQAADDSWSLRLTLGEIDALLRAVDDRDDALRRLVGEWEGEAPDPRPVVTVTPHLGNAGEGLEPDSDIPAWRGDFSPTFDDDHDTTA